MAVPAADVIESTKEAGLRYTSDERAGIRRQRAGRGFRYLGADGRPIADERELRRIRRLAIPPAWTDVWIATDPRGHLQATGRDAKGRKQYRYHERFREVRDETKYERMLDFAKALPKIRERVEADLAADGLEREKVLATIVRLLEATLIRVGNEEYAKENRSYGLTTLKERHVEVDGSRVRFRFRGKSGKEHDVDIRDRRVARVVRALQELPGQELFRYVDDDGQTRSIDSDDVNAYLREISGEDFTAKDFRTWAGTVLAAQALAALEPVENVRYAKRNITTAVQRVAARLGNTPAVCRRCYIHPAVLEAYIEGDLARTLRARAPEAPRDDDHADHADQAEHADRADHADGADPAAAESRVLRLLERRLAKAAKTAA
jgi:DNA topoisomerase I